MTKPKRSRSINESAIDSLSRREHSILEIRRKLTQKGFEEDDIEACIKNLIENNLLSEERFTESYINMRMRRGFGPQRIAQELRERGIIDEYFDGFLDHNNPKWRAVMHQQYSKKYGSKPAQEYAEKAKRAKYLQTRGFPLDWIFKINAIDLDDY